MRPLPWKAAAAAAIALGLSAADAQADFYRWTISANGGALTGAGNLETDAGSNILSFTGAIDGFAVALLGGQPGGIAYSATGVFFYDNLLLATAPWVDTAGILFSWKGAEANIFSGAPNSILSCAGGCFAVNDSAARFDVTKVPEPAALSLLGAGLLGLGLLTRRRDPALPEEPGAA